MNCYVIAIVTMSLVMSVTVDVRSQNLGHCKLVSVLFIVFFLSKEKYCLTDLLSDDMGYALLRATGRTTPNRKRYLRFASEFLVI